MIIYERFVIDWLAVGFLNKLNDRYVMQHMIFMKEMGYLSDILWRFEKKLSEFILFLKKLMEPFYIASLVLFIIYLQLYVPVQCTCRWIWYFFLLFNGVGSLDTSNRYDRQRQVLRINAIPTFQYVINFGWYWIPTALPYSKKDWVQIC